MLLRDPFLGWVLFDPDLKQWFFAAAIHQNIRGHFFSPGLSFSFFLIGPLFLMVPVLYLLSELAGRYDATRKPGAIGRYDCINCE